MKPVDSTPKKSHADAVRQHEQNVENHNARKNRTQPNAQDTYKSGSEPKAATAQPATPTILPDETMQPSSMPKATTAAGSPVPVVPITRTVEVSSAQELAAALSAAAPGDNIKLASGSYPGPITLSGKSGVTLSGPKDAVVTTPASTKKPSLSITDCNSCTVTGISITGGQKGLMVQNTQNSVFDGRVNLRSLHSRIHYYQPTVEPLPQ